MRYIFWKDGDQFEVVSKDADHEVILTAIAKFKRPRPWRGPSAVIPVLDKSNDLNFIEFIPLYLKEFDESVKEAS